MKIIILFLIIVLMSVGCSLPMDEVAIEDVNVRSVDHTIDYFGIYYPLKIRFESGFTFDNVIYVDGVGFIPKFTGE